MIDPDRFDLAAQLGMKLIEVDGGWPLTAEMRDQWARTAVQMADALIRECEETADAPTVVQAP